MDLATVGYCSSVVMYEKLPSDMVEGLRSRARRERRFLIFLRVDIVEKRRVSSVGKGFHIFRTDHSVPKAFKNTKQSWEVGWTFFDASTLTN